MLARGSSYNSRRWEARYAVRRLVISQSIAAIALVAVTIPGIIFAAWQLRVSARASQDSATQVKLSAEAASIAAQQAEIAANAAKANALGMIAAAGRDMQWRVLGDKALHPLLLPSASSAGMVDDEKQQLVRGMLISYYSFVFEFKLLGQIPEATWPAFVADMQDFFSYAPNRARWDKLKVVMSREDSKICGSRTASAPIVHEVRNMLFCNVDHIEPYYFQKHEKRARAFSEQLNLSMSYFVSWNWEVTGRLGALGRRRLRGSR